jgi:hypothetical protein
VRRIVALGRWGPGLAYQAACRGSEVVEVTNTVDNWQGPGVYEHYKGGHYIAVGLVRVEYDESEAVAYMTLDQEHREDQFYRGFLFTIRPLNPKDGPDPWNSFGVIGDKLIPRFTKLA